MSPTKCNHCDRPAPHSTLCQHCTRTLRMGLQKLASLHADLVDTVRTGTSRYGDAGSTRGSGEHPLLVSAHFVARDSRGTKLDAAVRNALVGWCRIVAEDWPPLAGPVHAEACTHLSCIGIRRRQLPTDTVTSMAVYLYRMAGSIVAESWAGDLLDQVLDLERQLRRIVDRPSDRWYAGACGYIVEPERSHDATSCACRCHLAPRFACDMPGGCSPELELIEAVVCMRPLWAEPGKREVRCPDCETTWPVDERRAILITEARERVATVEMITRIVTTLEDRPGQTARLSARIRQWAARGRITPCGTRVVDGRERKVYRVGEVLDLLDADKVSA